MKHQHLPHIDLPHYYQFVTFRTKDSTDDFLLKLYAQNKPRSEKQADIDVYLDTSNKGAYLYSDALLLLASLLRQKNGELYELVCFAIMPNHVHILFKPLKKLSDVMQSLKGGSARLLNKVLNRSGEFWAKDYYDRLIRDEKHFQTVYRYIKQNPMKLRDVGATEVALPNGNGSEAQGERRSLRKHPGVLASPSLSSHSATEVALPNGNEVLISYNERFYGIYE
ncbi:MAG: transposase [Ghiorsea sp.]|nr:transposase [Ghiorsea sp.]